MMQKLWQKKLELNYKSNVLDIVQFGSSMKEESNPNDIDIAVIFKSIPVREQLEEAQKIKRQLEKTSELPIHIVPYDFYTLFDPSNFAKESIIFYGKSIIYKDYFAKKLGLVPRIHISYSLKKMKKKDKIKFNYTLNGKGGSYGLIRKYGGKLLKPGLVEIFPEYEDIFIKALKKLNPQELNIEKVFFQI